MSEAREILTIGHSTHTEERFVELLRSHGIEVLADVRRFPGSRRMPHFNAGRLEKSLGAAAIEYVRMGDTLGGRRGSGSPADAFRAYAEHMQGEEFAAGLERLGRLATRRRTAIMCAEGDWRRCHRRLIADALTARGWRVVHVAPDGGSAEHEPTLGA